MAPPSLGRGDARPEDPRPQSMQLLENAAYERWENEGGAIGRIARHAASSGARLCARITSAKARSRARAT